MTVIVPKGYSGICIIGFSGNQTSTDSVTVTLNENGVGTIDGKFTDFSKSKNMNFFTFSQNQKMESLEDYSKIDKKVIDTSNIYIQHGLTINVNGKTYLLLRIGLSSFLSSEFNIDDPIIDSKINMVTW